MTDDNFIRLCDIVKHESEFTTKAWLTGCVSFCIVALWLTWMTCYVVAIRDELVSLRITVEQCQGTVK